MGALVLRVCEDVTASEIIDEVSELAIVLSLRSVIELTVKMVFFVTPHTWYMTRYMTGIDYKTVMKASGVEHNLA